MKIETAQQSKKKKEKDLNFIDNNKRKSELDVILFTEHLVIYVFN